MTNEIVLTLRAKHNYNSIIQYLLNGWSVKVANDFIDRFETVCELISTQPELYPFYEKRREVRKCIVTKHNFILYQHIENTIVIITVVETLINFLKLFFSLSLELPSRPNF